MFKLCVCIYLSTHIYLISKDMRCLELRYLGQGDSTLGKLFEIIVYQFQRQYDGKPQISNFK